MSFNGLKPAQAEVLALVAEEAGEVVQAVCKILRHGYESSHPNCPRTDNRDDLEQELGDLIGAMKLLVQIGDISEENVISHSVDKLESVAQYLHHAKVLP